ncbi:MAG: hypothetical protein S4CHLAM102_16080 [Chlamydiia bacterium]|nr:hypothetical protein [Chlamydiia bacterium]
MRFENRTPEFYSVIKRSMDSDVTISNQPEHFFDLDGAAIYEWTGDLPPEAVRSLDIIDVLGKEVPIRSILQSGRTGEDIFCGIAIGEVWTSGETDPDNKLLVTFKGKYDPIKGEKCLIDTLKKKFKERYDSKSYKLKDIETDFEHRLVQDKVGQVGVALIINGFAYPSVNENVEASFLGKKCALQKADYEIIPCGKEGVSDVIGASVNIGAYDVEAHVDLADSHIYTHSPINVSSMNTLRGPGDSFKLYLSQSNTISPLIIKQCKQELGSDLSALICDARANYKMTYNGKKSDPACTNRRIAEVAPTLLVGVREHDSDEKVPYENVIYALDMRQDATALDDIDELLGKKVFLVIDVNVLGTELVRSACYPVVNGLLWDEMMEVLTRTFKSKQVVGAAIVGMCPDMCSHTSNVAVATLMKKICVLHKKYSSSLQ